MKLLKQITAVMAALLIVVNVSFINTSAAMAAPVAGAELAAFLIELLLGAGHSQSEIYGMSIYDMQNTVKKDIETNVIDINTKVPSYKGPYMPTPDGVALLGTAALLDWLANDPNNVLGRQIIANALNDFISDDDVLSNSESYFELTNDMNGYGVKMIVTSNSTRQIWYGDYIVLYSNPNNPEQFYARMFGGLYIEHYKQNPDTKLFELRYTDGRDGDAFVSNSSEDFFEKINSGFYQITGDVRYTLDSPALPDFEVDNECRVGALPDGTVVTPDMLNPDGTVTVDGVTYDPVDYLDPDNLTDEGKHALIDAIADAISNIYVVADDKPIVDADDITVEVAEDLENFTVPKGIITVFPFCLPFDFVRGMKTLVQKPKVPVFKAELDLTDFCGYDLGKHTIEISFEKWEPAAVICRWFFILLFAYTLILLTPKICKGAG